MSNPGKGGRGKSAPYSTIHYRIPEPIKPIVEKFASAFRKSVGEGGIEKSFELINRVNAAISNDKLESEGQLDIYQAIIDKLEKDLELANREIERLKLSRQEANKILVPLLEWKTRQKLSDLKKELETVIKELVK